METVKKAEMDAEVLYSCWCCRFVHLKTCFGRLFSSGKVCSFFGNVAVLGISCPLPEEERFSWSTHTNLFSLNEHVCPEPVHNFLTGYAALHCDVLHCRLCSRRFFRCRFAYRLVFFERPGIVSSALHDEACTVYTCLVQVGCSQDESVGREEIMLVVKADIATNGKAHFIIFCSILALRLEIEQIFPKSLLLVICARYLDEIESCIHEFLDQGVLYLDECPHLVFFGRR